MLQVQKEMIPTKQLILGTEPINIVGYFLHIVRQFYDFFVVALRLTPTSVCNSKFASGGSLCMSKITSNRESKPLCMSKTPSNRESKWVRHFAS
jgi:hypothetical protein